MFDDDFIPLPLVPEGDDLDDVITERMRAIDFAAADMPGVL
jgi:hypothetical protein